MLKSLLVSTAVMALLSVPAIAHGSKAPAAQGHAAHAAAADAIPVTGDAQVDIPVKLKSIFESEGKPLAVAPVVVSGGWAIAGWTQDGRGGRALLKQKADGWSIHLCSGDSLKDAGILQQIGIAEHDAQTLAVNLASAEATLDAKTLALFASFEGTVMVEGEAHGHGAVNGNGHGGQGAAPASAKH